MRTAALEYISNRLLLAGIPYAFKDWESEIPEYYFVGDYIEHPSPTREENGRQTSTFILRGFTRLGWLPLHAAKEVIEAKLPVTDILPDGSGICISYDSASPVPTSDPDIKSIKIDFTVDEWMVK